MASNGDTPLAGWCDPAFGAVREEFAENFRSRGELGAALCVSVGGRVVIDLTGGWADAARTRPWSPDTLVNVFSVGKALSAVVVAVLVANGTLDVEERVRRYWPEFGGQGKEDVTLRELLSHQAGLPAVRGSLPERAMLDQDLMASVLAHERPWWKPGTAHGYHVNTFGFLVAEVVRRASGLTVGQLLRRRVAEPLGADVHIGLPASEHARVAEFVWSSPGSSPEPAPPDVAPVDPALLTEEQRMEYNAYRNPPGLSGIGWVNMAEWRSTEIPSTNGHASARGVARVYTALAAGGGGIVPSAVLDLFTTEVVAGEDRVLHRPSRFGLGFQLTQPERPLGPGARSFGHFGAGGSLGFADPDRRLAFGYVVNAMGPRWQNPRNRALLDAVAAGLGG
ncbi:MAG TPA: serine hydrolase domain-containing protein [Acidimicrobiales bacterium]|nr:serine hydrolase domain-containing protein [Acidimicrobiales bacterium]